LAVVGNEYDQPAIGNVAQAEDLDVSIITLDNFNSMARLHLFSQLVEHLQQHTPWVLPFLFYPAEGIAEETLQFPKEVELMRLRRALLTNQEVNLRQARGLWRDGEHYKSKKRCVGIIQIFETIEYFSFCK
jgi:hypothetical protein